MTLNPIRVHKLSRAAEPRADRGQDILLLFHSIAALWATPRKTPGRSAERFRQAGDTRAIGRPRFLLLVWPRTGIAQSHSACYDSGQLSQHSRSDPHATEIGIWTQEDAVGHVQVATGEGTMRAWPGRTVRSQAGRRNPFACTRRSSLQHAAKLILCRC